MKVASDIGTGDIALLCIHGSAANHTTWTLQKPLAKHFRLVVVDRNCVDGSPDTSIAADCDAARRIVDEMATPVIVVGSSLGGVIALELALAAPSNLRGVVACEPPMPPHPWVPGVPTPFGCLFEGLRQRDGALAARLFLRAVLGDQAVDRIPNMWLPQLLAMSGPLAKDARALANYQINRPALARLKLPVLFVAGAQSPPSYRDIIEAVAPLLSHVEVATIDGASHMMQLEKHHAFNRLVRDFARAVG